MAVPPFDPPEGGFDRTLRLLRKKLSDAEELADLLEPPPAPAPEPVTIDPPRPISRFDDPKLRRLAEPGVGRVEFGRRDALNTEVSIDGAPSFALPNKLAGLLRDLVDAQGPRADAFAPFVAVKTLAQARGIGRHAINVAIGRLRTRLLDDGGVSPLLIERDRGQVRIRLRHASAPPS